MEKRKSQRTRQRTRQLIRVGQRLINWDGQKGYVALNTKGKSFFGPGEQFLVEWLDADGEIEDATYFTLEQFEHEGVQFGRGVMPWAGGKA
jgi:hypothetical protein